MIKAREAGAAVGQGQ